MSQTREASNLEGQKLQQIVRCFLKHSPEELAKTKCEIEGCILDHAGPLRQHIYHQEEEAEDGPIPFHTFMGTIEHKLATVGRHREKNRRMISERGDNLDQQILTRRPRIRGSSVTPHERFEQDLERQRAGRRSRSEASPREVKSGHTLTA